MLRISRIFALVFFAVEFSLSLYSFHNLNNASIIIGQDFESIIHYVTELQSTPHGFMTYTSLRNLSGLNSSIEYGSGIEWTKGLINLYPDTTVQLGLWLVDLCDDVIAGKLDIYINILSDFMAMYASVRFLLRIGYEFDSLENMYPTREYKLAFRHIVDSVRQSHLEVKNVAFVWHAAAFAPRNNLKYEDWFPGEDYVDYCGVSLFQQPYEETVESGQFRMEYPDQFARLCRDKFSKPVMIAESTPLGGIVDDETCREETMKTSDRCVNRAGFHGLTWDIWFLPVMRFIERNDIQLWSYINCDWDSFPMWQSHHSPGVSWGDTRIEAHPFTRRRWEEEVLGRNLNDQNHSVMVQRRFNLRNESTFLGLDTGSQGWIPSDRNNTISLMRTVQRWTQCLIIIIMIILVCSSIMLGMFLLFSHTALFRYLEDRGVECLETVFGDSLHQYQQLYDEMDDPSQFHVYHTDGGSRYYQLSSSRHT